MNRAISNIAWPAEADSFVYEVMRKKGFAGLEIAPTRIFEKNPYEDLSRAKAWAKKLRNEESLRTVSMQSVWYGRTERLFGCDEERAVLRDYTKAAVDFANAIECANIVFGSPKNRSIPEDMSPSKVEQISDSFFYDIGEYALAHGVFIGLEANPAVYGTNFINTTEEAVDFIERLGSKGLLLNLDIGTMIQNGETVDVLAGKTHLISHVHISEPHLIPIKHRELHRQVLQHIKNDKYPNYVSIEMGSTGKTDDAVAAMEYLCGLEEGL